LITRPAGVGFWREALAVINMLDTEDPSVIVRGAFESHACYLACILTCAFNGIIYAFPIFTPKLQEAGLQGTDIVMVGVMLQLGYAVISYPFAKFYNGNVLNLSPFALDRFVSAACTLLVCIAFCVLISGLIYSDQHHVPLSLTLTCTGHFLWSIGMGVSFFQSTTIVNFLFARDKGLRRKAVSIMSVGKAIASCLFAAMLYCTLPSFSLVNVYVVLFAIYILISTVRIRYMVRDRFDEIPTLHIPGESIVSDSLALATSASSSSAAVVMDNSELEERDRLTDDAEDVSSGVIVNNDLEGNTLDYSPQQSRPIELERETNDDEDETSLSGTAQALDQLIRTISRRPTRLDYLKDPVVWLTTVSGFFAFGIGAIYLYSLGNLAEEIVDAYSVSQTTFSLTMTFLGLVLFARVLVFIIYAHFKWAHINTIWNVFLFAGLIIYVAYPTLTGAYVATGLVGFGFGGIMTCTSVISTTSFPGGVADSAINLAVAFSLMNLGPFVLLLLMTVIYAKSPLTNFNEAEIKSISTYIYFLSVTFFSTACSAALGVYLNKSFKLERETSSRHSQPGHILRALAEHQSDHFRHEAHAVHGARDQQEIELSRITHQGTSRVSRALSRSSADSGPSALELLFM